MLLLVGWVIWNNKPLTIDHFKFLAFFTGSSTFAIKTHQNYTCCFCYGPTTENLYNKRFENMSIFKIWFTSTLAGNTACNYRTHYHLVLSHKTYQNQGICYIILCYHFYCIRKLVSCVTHLQSCAKVDIWNKKKKLRTVAKIKTQDYKNWAQLQLLH